MQKKMLDNLFVLGQIERMFCSGVKEDTDTAGRSGSVMPEIRAMETAECGCHI